jgi:hypothetical protein
LLMLTFDTETCLRHSPVFFELQSKGYFCIYLNNLSKLAIVRLLKVGISQR